MAGKIIAGRVDFFAVCGYDSDNMETLEAIEKAIAVINGPHCLDTEEAAKILGVKERQVRWYVEQGHLPRLEVVGCLVLPRDAVEKLKDNKPKRTGRPPKKSVSAKARKKKNR